MKKVFLYVLVLLVVTASFAVTDVKAGGANCATVGNVTTCYTMVAPNLDQTRVGGYALFEATAWSRVVGENGDITVYQIAHNLASAGSYNDKTNEIYGFYSVVRVSGDTVYFPVDRCYTAYNGKIPNTSCYSFKPVVLPAKVGGYSFAEATGLVVKEYMGSWDSVIVKPGIGISGSLKADRSVVGFDMVVSSTGEPRYYPVAK